MRVALFTHHKAGTHWTKYILSNYINLDLFGSEAGRVDFDNMEESFFPLRLDYHGFGAHPLGSRLLRQYGISEIYWAHVSPKRNRGMESIDKVAFQCRNLLDFLVSKFHYDLKRLNLSRGSSENLKVSRPYDLHPKTTLNWCEIVRWMSERAAEQPSQFQMFHYEDLKSEPVAGFTEMIRFLLTMKPQHDFVVKAVERSTIGFTREDEKRRGKPIVGHTYTISDDGRFKGSSFARSGAVRQYRNYFSQEEILSISNLAEKFLPRYLHHLIIPKDSS